MKRTALWLKGLHPLIHARENELFYARSHTEVPEPTYIDIVSGKKRYFTDAISGGIKGQKERSKTFQSIANAMAAQWGALK